MANKIQIKRGLQANLPTLDVGEPALTTNSGSEKIYIGTGSGNKEVSDLLVKYGTATGTNAYVVSIPRVTTLTTGLEVTVKFTNASTGTTTINVSGLGVKNIIKAGGGSPKIKAGGVYNLFYDGTSFQLLGEGGEYGTALATDVLSGKTIGTDNGLVTGTIPSKGVATITPSASAQTIAAGQYLSGVQTISAVAGLSAANIKNATVVGGVTGTYKGLGNATAAQVLATRTFSTATLTNTTGTMVNRGAVTSTLTTQGGAYTIPVGYHSGTGKVTASFTNLVAGNVKSGVNIGGVVGNLPSPYFIMEIDNTLTIGAGAWGVILNLSNVFPANLSSLHFVGDMNNNSTQGFGVPFHINKSHAKNCYPEVNIPMNATSSTSYEATMTGIEFLADVSGSTCYFRSNLTYKHPTYNRTTNSSWGATAYSSLSDYLSKAGGLKLSIKNVGTASQIYKMKGYLIGISK